MGILENLPVVGGMFRRQPETQQQDQSLLQVPLPMPSTSNPPKHETVVYMTENKFVPTDLNETAFAWDVQNMSFWNLPNEYDRLRIVRRYEQERRIQENFMPLVKVYKPGLQEEINRRQYTNLVDGTLSKAVQGNFQKTVTASTNLVETKTQTMLPGQQNNIGGEKKSTGLAGLLGL
jgi:hypothetical protein